MEKINRYDMDQIDYDYYVMSASEEGDYVKYEDHGRIVDGLIEEVNALHEELVALLNKYT